MNREDFSDAALIVLGHGTAQNAGSGDPVLQHAADLRRRRIFGEVHGAFWKQQPQVKQVLSEIKAARVFIAPLFISEGYFSDEVIPLELGFAQNSRRRTQDARLFYCRPIGTHESMTHVILARAREVAEEFPFPRAPKPQDTTLFIAGHGTERNAKSRQSIERQAEVIRGQQLYAGVHAIFMEDEPRIAACYALAATRNLIVVPFFISDGLHTQEDIPVLLGEPERLVKQRLATGQPVWRNPTERTGKLVWYSPAVGTAPQIADVILERVREQARLED